MPASHDARKTLSDLRDHLARHDRPIAFLFGAGTSSAIRVPSLADPAVPEGLVPAVVALTGLCKAKVDALGPKFATAWTQVATNIVENGQIAHVENILSRLRMMLGAVGTGDTLVGLSGDELKHMEEAVRKTIAKHVTPDLGRLPNAFPHRMFARWLAKTDRRTPVEIFTVNYDVMIEHALEAERVPLFDGFVGAYQPYFHADTLRHQNSAPGANWIRLWKMHGSVTWQRIDQDGRKRVIRGEPDESGEMIYPSFEKYDESRQQPYSAYADRLRRFLDQEDAMLVALGYSFGDEHINNVIFGALENRTRTHAYAVQFEEVPTNGDLAMRSMQRPNMLVIGPKTGCIGGRHASWDASDPTPSSDTTFIISNNEAGVPTLTMNLGDFNVFCKFLEAMSPG